jgi:hypothetical protein
LINLSKQKVDKKSEIFFQFFENLSINLDDQVKSSKRYANGSIKHEINTDNIDNIIQQKKSKTSHASKQEPTTVSINIKDESNVVFNNELPYASNMATVPPMIVQPKKEKPTAK